MQSHNFISNEGNLIIFLSSKDIAEGNKIIVKKVKKKSEEEQGGKWK